VAVLWVPLSSWFPSLATLSWLWGSPQVACGGLRRCPPSPPFFNDFCETPISSLISTEFNTFLNIDYIKERNTFKFTNKLIEGNILINSNNCDKILGIKTELLVQTSIESSYINLTNYSHIIIKSNNILFEDNTQDNIDNVDFGNSSILFMIDKQDIPPFQLISYRNYDKSDNYSYNISNRQINNIDLHLYNEKGEVLTDTDDYFITLKIVIFNKEEIKPDTYLEDIRFLLMNLIFNNKKKNVILE
jgi:hypothetical protein